MAILISGLGMVKLSTDVGAFVNLTSARCCSLYDALDSRAADPNATDAEVIGTEDPLAQKSLIDAISEQRETRQ